MWDLSSPTVDLTRTPALEACRLNHWTAREVPEGDFLRSLYSKQSRLQTRAATQTAGVLVCWVRLQHTS